MAEPTQAVKQEMELVYAVDQQVSVNAFIDVEVDGEPVRFQITSRYNSTPEKIVKTALAAIEAFRALRQEHPRTLVQPQTAQPAGNNDRRADEHAGTWDDPRSFVPTLLTVQYDKGKPLFKVHGQDGKFPKFPVIVWPEVLEKSGINPDSVDPKEGMKLEDCVALYIVNEKGNPAKVIKFSEVPF